MFHFNFWWYGKWVEIVVDDYLPTDGRDLIFCSNKERPNEFWPAMLEKAYAKLRGCYEALDGGKLQDAMVDLTGGISEVINLQDKAKVKDNLYDLLMKSYGMKSLQGCCIFKPEGAKESEVEMPNGLYMGHAYSITGFQQLKTNRGVIRLLRIRNPWGRGEWKGAWSDNSAEMTHLPQNIKEEMNVQNKDEGEFWISFEDFVKNIDEIQICHLQVDAMLAEMEDNDIKQNWNVTVFHDEWIRGVTAGGCGNNPKMYWKNPQFHVKLQKPDEVLSRHTGDCTLIVSLMEKEMDNQSKIAIGFDVYQLKNPELLPLDDRRAPANALQLSKRSGKYQFYREVTMRFELPPGHYVIIPSTFYPNEEAKFMLRLFTEKFAESHVLEEAEPTTAATSHPPVFSPKDFVLDLFNKYAGNDAKLDSTELQKFLEVISDEDIKHRIAFSVEQCRSILPLFDESHSGRLAFQEAKKLWKEIKAYRDVFLQFDADRSNTVDTFELTSMFNKLGFPVSRPVLTSIVRRYGDRDNRISLTDFVVVVMRLVQLFQVFMAQEVKNGRTGVAEFTRNEFLQHTMYL